MLLLFHIILLVSCFVIAPFVAEIFVLLWMGIALSLLKFGIKLWLANITYISSVPSFLHQLLLVLFQGFWIVCLFVSLYIFMLCYAEHFFGFVVISRLSATICNLLCLFFITNYIEYASVEYKWKLLGNIILLHMLYINYILFT